MIFWIVFSYFVSHSWGIPMMKITGLSHLFKWENLHNWWLTKYFFAPLYMPNQLHGRHQWEGCTVRGWDTHKWHSFCSRNRSCSPGRPLVPQTMVQLYPPHLLQVSHCPYKVTLQRGLLQSLPLECQARQVSMQCANSCSIIKCKQTHAGLLESWPREPICLNFAKVFRVKTGKIWEKFYICWKPSVCFVCQGPSACLLLFHWRSLSLSLSFSHFPQHQAYLY